MEIRKFLAAALTAGMMLSFVPSSAMADSTGWREDDGYWMYYTSESEYCVNTWKEIGGYWYYFRDNGHALMDTWVWIDGDMYHFDTKGHMEKNKWIPCGYFITGYKYEDGHPVYDKSRTQWRYVGSNGKAYSGWKKINGSWYFFGDDKSGPFSDDYGIMAVRQNYFVQTGADYYLQYWFDDNGKMVTNSWHQDINGFWFYFGADGRAYEGWHKINNKWYYFEYDYKMVTGVCVDYDGEVHITDNSGAMITKTGWHWDSKTNAWYYIKAGGKCCQAEWLSLGGKWYFFDINGKMISNRKDVIVNERLYDFNSSGVCTNPDSGRKISKWKKVYNPYYYGDEEYDWWVYADANGKLYRERWLESGKDKYYFNDLGFMIDGWEQFRSPDGKLVSFEPGTGKATDLIGGRTGWIKINDYRWTYAGPNGEYYSDEWKKIGGGWYYFDYDGVALSNCFFPHNDKLYFLDENGRMVTGWFWVEDGWDDCWHYAYSNGELIRNGWLYYRGSWYYLRQEGSAGAMITDRSDVLIDGRSYDFGPDGKCLNPDDPHIYIVYDYVIEG